MNSRSLSVSLSHPLIPNPLLSLSLFLSLSLYFMCTQTHTSPCARTLTHVLAKDAYDDVNLCHNRYNDAESVPGQRSASLPEMPFNMLSFSHAPAVSLVCTHNTHTHTRTHTYTHTCTRTHSVRKTTRRVWQRRPGASSSRCCKNKVTANSTTSMPAISEEEDACNLSLGEKN